MARRVNSKAKGNRFERVVCKSFQNWSGYEFSRTPASGGLRWKKADNISSDVICSDPKHSKKFPFSIEVKNYQDIKFEHILLGLKSCKIISFWEQATKDAKRAGKIPILIMRYNSMPKGEAFFIVEAGEIDSFLMENCSELSRMEIKTPRVHLAVYMFKEIQRLVTYSDVFKYARKLLK